MWHRSGTGENWERAKVIGRRGIKGGGGQGDRQMWTQPTIVSGPLLGKSKWEMKQQSAQFMLQQKEEAFRIVTRSFPTYLGKHACAF